MDDQALIAVHDGLVRKGFTGTLTSLSKLLAIAEDSTQERQAIRYWGSVGTSAQASLVRSAFAHARKHRLKVHYSSIRPGHVTFASRRTDSAIRRATLDITQEGARLVFSEKGECIGERRIRWTGDQTTT